MVTYKILKPIILSFATYNDQYMQTVYDGTIEINESGTTMYWNGKESITMVHPYIDQLLENLCIQPVENK
jgi:hypothetical protein